MRLFTAARSKTVHMTTDVKRITPEGFLAAPRVVTVCGRSLINGPFAIVDDPDPDKVCSKCKDVIE